MTISTTSSRNIYSNYILHDLRKIKEIEKVKINMKYLKLNQNQNQKKLQLQGEEEKNIGTGLRENDHELLSIETQIWSSEREVR